MVSILQENIESLNKLKEKMIKTAQELPYFDIINSFFDNNKVLATELTRRNQRYNYI